MDRIIRGANAHLMSVPAKPWVIGPRFVRSESKNQSQAGVTLVELLLAMTILGLAVSVVILNTPSGGQTAKREATRFAARLNAASDEAIISGEVIGLDVSLRDYRFLRLRNGEWVDTQNRVLSRWALDDRVTFSLLPLESGRQSLSQALARNDEIIKGNGSSLFVQTDDEDKENILAPTFQFRPIGADTPLNALFTDRTGQWIVRLNSNGQIDIDPYEVAGQ